MTKQTRLLLCILVPLCVLLILGGALVVAVGARRYNKANTGAMIDEAKTLVRLTGTAVSLYQMRMNEVPDDGVGLKALFTPPQDEKRKAKWLETGPFLNKPLVPVDPWGNELRYVKVQTTGDGTDVPFHVYSLGPNKTDDHGTGDDIPAWAE